MAAAFALEQFFTIPFAHTPSFSPDGQRVAFLCNRTGLPQVWSAPAGGGEARQLTVAAERVGGLAYSPAADELVFAMDAGGDEHHQLYRLGGQGGAAEALTAAPAAMHHFGGWSADGRRIAFSANRRHRQFFDLYVRDVATGAERLVAEGQGLIQPAGFTPDGRALAYTRANTNLDNDLFLVDLDTGAERHLTPHGGEARYAALQFTPDGRAAYLVTDAGREFDALVRLELDTGAWTAVATPPWDVETCRLSPDGRYLAYGVNAGGVSELHILDLHRGREVPAPALPRGVYSEYAWAPDGRRLALVVDAAHQPMDVWLVDVPAGTASPLTASAGAGIPPQTFVFPELVSCTSFDGLAVPAWLYRPAGARPDGTLPMVMMVHGGPESQARPIFNKAIQYLVHRGYAVLQPNVRGSTGYGKAYTHLDDRRRRFDAVADLKALWHWAVDQGWAHPRRVAVWGGSYGGFMVLAAVTTYPELWAAGVDIVGIANLETFLENTHPHRRYLREAEYGSLAEDREWFRQVSPIYHVQRIRAAMLVIHGANDPRVPVSEAEQIVASLRELGRPVEYLRFPDEGHGLVKIPNQIAAYSRAVAFLDQHLRG